MALEFACKCGEYDLQGVDLITLDSTGTKIVELAVVGRPPKAIQVILEHQSKYLKEFLEKEGAATGAKAKKSKL